MPRKLPWVVKVEPKQEQEANVSPDGIPTRDTGTKRPKHQEDTDDDDLDSPPRASKRGMYDTLYPCRYPLIIVIQDARVRQWHSLLLKNT
jgi:hypothetical protein